jgi:hypothetical protein
MKCLLFSYPKLRLLRDAEAYGMDGMGSMDGKGRRPGTVIYFFELNLFNGVPF